MSAYDFSIAYKPGNKHVNADSLSRLPLGNIPRDPPPPAELVLLVDTLHTSPTTLQNICQWTDRAPLISKVRELVLHGWKDGEDDDMLPFNRRKNELSVQDGCVLWGSRVIVPTQGQVQVLDQLHQSHPGILQMKGIALSMVRWPGIDADIEAKVKDCQQCQQNQKQPAKSPLQAWKWPAEPQSRLHIDNAGLPGKNVSATD